ncbi:MAG: T9SS type A sorting domain-containing protein [Bacteroidia bacterium]
MTIIFPAFSGLPVLKCNFVLNDSSMRNFLTFVLLSPAFVFAQKNTPAISDNGMQKQLPVKTDRIDLCAVQFDPDAKDESVINFCSQLPEMCNQDCHLQVTDKKESLVGSHIFLQHYYRQIPVYGSYVKLNLDKNGKQISSSNHLYNSQNWNSVSHPNDVTKGSPVFVVLNDQLIPAYKNRINSFEVFSDINGSILFRNDLRTYFQNDDTTIYAMVFKPDPLSTSRNLYGTNGTYKHFHDSDYALLNGQRQAVTFPGKFDTGYFFLENAFAKSVDLQSPDSAPTVLKTANFATLRSSATFKETMAMYHIYAAHQYVQSIGFGNYPSFQLKVDALSGTADNSYFSESDSSLNFGTGGVPDAEDADVIVHEYTHSITHTINTLGVSSSERHALDEAISDAMASAYSRALTDFNWRWLYNWDGHNEFWPGRDAGSSKTYLDYDPVNYYYSSEIWSATMDDLVEILGRDTTFKLLFTSLSFYTPFTTMPDAALYFLQADSMLYAKYNSWKIRPVFNARKLRNDTLGIGINEVSLSNNFSIFNTSAFASGSGDALIELPAVSNITIYNLHGQKMGEMKQVSGKINLSPALFNPGFYFIVIENNNGIYTTKLTRF